MDKQELKEKEPLIFETIELVCQNNYGTLILLQILSDYEYMCYGQNGTFWIKFNPYLKTFETKTKLEYLLENSK